MNVESWSIVARKDVITRKTVMVVRGIAFTWIINNLEAQEHLQPCFGASPHFSFDPRCEETYRMNIQASLCSFTHKLYLTAFDKCSAKTFCISVEADAAEIVRREVTCQSSEVTRTFLLDGSTVFQNMCLVGDQLVIRIEPKEAVRTGDGPTSTAVGPDGNPADDGTLKLAKDMKRVLHEAKFSDVAFQSEGRDIRAHRIILSGRSLVFERMFQQPTRKSHDSVVDVGNVVEDGEEIVGDLAHNPLQRLVAYVYSVFERLFQMPTQENQDDVHVEDGVVGVEDGVVGVEDGVGSVEDGLIHVKDGVVGVENGVTDVKNGIVHMEDVAHDTLQRLVTYLYTGQLTEQLTFESAIALFVASDKYDVHDLRDVCAEVILKDLRVDNYFRVLGLANRHGDARLRRACKAFIEDHYRLEMETQIRRRALRLEEDMKGLLQKAKFSCCRTGD